MNESDEFTIGVEEEYQIINPQTRELCGKAERIIQDAQKTLNCNHSFPLPKKLGLSL